MANPAAIYIVEYAGDQLPGYVQAQDAPIALGANVEKVFGRDGGIRTPTGANLKPIALQFYLKSDLGSGSGLEHLDNVLDQYREAAAILTRPYGENALVIHDTDRYYLASVERVGAPMTADRTSLSLRYNVDFLAQPWAIGTTAVTDTLTGNGTATLAIGTDSRRTYPIVRVGDGVDTFTATDGNKTIEFVRGDNTSTIEIDCARMLVYNFPSLTSAFQTMASLNFGLYYDDGTGTYDIDVTDYSGSGDLIFSMYPRYEL